ncbi:helix-turn-helix transcriptional regulator [Mediterraneibacter sp. NSJ-151]|uniref:winged helix-turn-helix transcriptional regulator n=1 Tax=Mediterraneibacter sp. NSJ-151 TaxID=2897708 RepID=UPI001F0B6A10|nr:helix-turn-helix domain-containing protein [Mediterraneibacter sp. NSJ-151]MCH4279549.1 helix-turn-helix transcriptional regulator [Mediterraneibacter sp. NSJ-151]
MKTKDELPICPVATAVSLIGGKWKLLIIRNLKERPWRFNELQRDIEGISQKVLTDSLRQMIDNGLVYRHDYQEMPPKVEYGLTELGKEMLPIIDALADFGNYYKSIID